MTRYDQWQVWAKVIEAALVAHRGRVGPGDFAHFLHNLEFEGRSLEWVRWDIGGRAGAEPGIPQPEPLPPTPPVPPPPPSTLKPLTPDGPIFRVDGAPWRWAGCSAFLLGIRLAKGQDVTPFLDWAQQTGFNVLRVFAVMSIVPPKRGLPPFILSPDEVTRLLEVVNARGMYVEFTGGDYQILMPDYKDQRRYLESIAAVMSSNPLEYCNEPWKNGMDVERMGSFPGVVQASGNYTLRNTWDASKNRMIQTMPAVRDYLTTHSERKAEWPRVPHEMEELRRGWKGVVERGPHAGKLEIFTGVRVPVVEDEPTGAAEVADGNSRSDVPADFFDYAATCALFGAGGTFHSSAGVDTLVPGPVQQACAQQFMAGMQAVPINAPFWDYTRGGRSNCPLEHDDAKALRTYVKINGNYAVALVVRPTRHTSADRVARQGWHITATAGDRHNVMYLER